jgi:hypothetical protein
MAALQCRQQQRQQQRHHDWQQQPLPQLLQHADMYFCLKANRSLLWRSVEGSSTGEFLRGAAAVSLCGLQQQR